MTLVLIGKGLLLEGSNPKMKDKQVPGNHYFWIQIHIENLPGFNQFFFGRPVFFSWLFS